MNLQAVPFEGGTLLIEPALMDQRGALLEQVTQFMRKVAEAKAAREAAAADAPKIVAAIHRITGLETDHDASQAMFTDIAENAAVIPAPPEKFRVYAVQSETIKTFLRSGNQLPGEQRGRTKGSGVIGGKSTTPDPLFASCSQAETIKAFLRSGNQLPDFSYDATQDRATYKGNKGVGSHWWQINDSRPPLRPPLAAGDPIIALHKLLVSYGYSCGYRRPYRSRKARNSDSG